MPAENVLDISFPIQNDFALTEDHRSLFVVHIQQDRRNFRMFFPESLHEIILSGKDRRGEDQHDHDLPCDMGRPY